MKRYLWLAAFVFLAVIAITGWSLPPTVLTLWFRHDVAVTLGRQTITQTDLREALRGELWRQGKTWDPLTAEERTEVRRQVLEQLIDEHLIRHYRQQSARVPLNEAAVQTELSMWRKQFPEADEAPQRLALQELTEPLLEAEMRTRQLDQAWIEQQITGPLKGVTALEAKKWYVENREALRVPETFRASHIYLTRHDATKPDREPEIRKIQQQLAADEDAFAALAEQFSEDERSKVRGGDLDWFTAERMPTDFMAAIGRLKVGQTSAPVLTALGWHIIELTARKPAFIPRFEAVSAEIEAALASQRRSSAVKLLLQKLRQRAERERLIHRHADVIEATLPAEIGT